MLGGTVARWRGSGCRRSSTRRRRRCGPTSRTSPATSSGWPTRAAIRFLSDQRSGVGTRFECDTKIGPFTTTDVMEITEWVPGKAMGVRHSGVVTGTGRFTLKKARGGRTQFQWRERLVFPLWLGGPVGAFAAKPVLELGVAPQPPAPGRPLLGDQDRRAGHDHARAWRRRRGSPTGPSGSVGPTSVRIQPARKPTIRPPTWPPMEMSRDS